MKNGHQRAQGIFNSARFLAMDHIQLYQFSGSSQCQCEIFSKAKQLVTKRTLTLNKK
jgi:hypothetical protein